MENQMNDKSAGCVLVGLLILGILVFMIVNAAGGFPDLTPGESSLVPVTAATPTAAPTQAAPTQAATPAANSTLQAVLDHRQVVEAQATETAIALQQAREQNEFIARATQQVMEQQATQVALAGQAAAITATLVQHQANVSATAQAAAGERQERTARIAQENTVAGAVALLAAVDALMLIIAGRALLRRIPRETQARLTPQQPGKARSQKAAAAVMKALPSTYPGIQKNGSAVRLKNLGKPVPAEEISLKDLPMAG